ncbi:hypothetical protein BJF83_07300 [Nocardiopsis sp. CNR-923]|uniref:DUF2397 family protein n=1 Tax=Nocardiopsis sp. CNR-923 TaxID=1904965 RepID=UPI0009649D5E|nr:DUF2397 family protein [Nocardiopsis sp. CNR-923]OLT24265.1 hypothetical protein BJF83_07300 [Nocardiopsis sp. CNR-923]
MGLKERPDDRADDGQGLGDPPVPRHGRAALLRLASWFEEADTDRAEALATAAYGLHSDLRLAGRTDDGVAATTSWWHADPDRGTVTERPGTRPPEPVRDHRAQRARLRDAAESSAHWRRAGASRIRVLLAEPTGDRARLDLSGPGMEVLMELLTAALGSGDASRRPTSAGDLEFSLRLHVFSAPGAEVTVLGEGGELTLAGLRLCVTPYDQHVLDLPAAPEPTPPPAVPSDAQEPAGPPAPVDGREPRFRGWRESAPSQPSRDLQQSPGHPAPRAAPGSTAAEDPLARTEDARAASAADAVTGPIPVVTSDTTQPSAVGGRGDPAREGTATPPHDGTANPDNETTGPIDLSAHRREVL